jgi:hypothetical protein
MAYKRIDPTFNKDPEIKKTTIQNPDGTTTYRDTWSSKKPARSSSFKSPEAKQGTKTSYVAKKSTPAQTTSGSREITSIPSLKPVGTMSKEITAPVDIKVPVKTATRKERFESDKSTWQKDHPGKVWEDRYKDTETSKTEREWKGGGIFKEKKAVKLCKTC